jgi:hypothetical protein
MPKKRRRRVKPDKKKGVHARAPESLLKFSIRRHFTRLGFIKAEDGSLVLPGVEKPTIRTLHAQQRAERLGESEEFLARALPKALPSFANGSEIDPAKIQLRLIRVRSGTKESDLFRIASLTWSVPVSVGYGRRLRYLVWDDHHQRLVGLIALGDPVFNLSVRDNLIGWDAATRAKRLVRMLDAYVLGAVPPYNMLLCGKAVACLVRSREVFEDFRKTYGGTIGIISKKQKRANLLAVTTTSSMGRSSVYNRLTLGGQKYFEPIGYTVGWGHFHITDRVFAAIRRYLRLKRDPYANNHKFGQGPNWRLRTIRRGLDVLNISRSVLRHGIQREVFICPFGANALDILKSGKGKLDTSTLLTVREISDLARERWIVPRAARRPDYKAWDRRSIPDLINGAVAPAARSKSRSA